MQQPRGRTEILPLLRRYIPDIVGFGVSKGITQSFQIQSSAAMGTSIKYQIGIPFCQSAPYSQITFAILHFRNTRSRDTVLVSDITVICCPRICRVDIEVLTVYGNTVFFDQSVQKLDDIIYCFRQAVIDNAYPLRIFTVLFQHLIQRRVIRHLSLSFNTGCTDIGFQYSLCIDHTVPKIKRCLGIGNRTLYFYPQRKSDIAFFSQIRDRFEESVTILGLRNPMTHMGPFSHVLTHRP